LKEDKPLDEYLVLVIPLKIAAKLLASDNNQAEVFIKRIKILQGNVFVTGFNYN
jgi:hypothetical protein